MNGTELSPWRGRLAIRVESEPAQVFSAAFELSGSAPAGALTLFTPLGTTAAALSWTPEGSTLRSNAEVRQFATLGALMRQTLGAELPITALFAWLAGDTAASDGWQVDLSQRPNGRITVRRQSPLPMAEMRVVLDP
jgi:outer membrane lipoprotein LolB